MKTFPYLLALASLFQSGIGAPHEQPRPLRIRANTISPGEANQIHTVIVGGSQDIILPNLILAKVGDIVQFQFSNGNHTITEGIEGSGCQPLQKSNPLAIHSGHLPFKKGDQDVMIFNVPINDLNPRLLYCATGPHCQTGQVAAINPRNGQQLVNYMKSCQQAKENVDAGSPSGGIVAKIPLENAAFIPAEPEGA
ncbi:extracellular serine-rich protein [Metarhizium guizhouense ARSEF 977]|uniref:Extracellular serine-rich protein n=1 Tax=Metarhizium guizhouense (strain ARSEF 977) TaxID=1276136 RepID=A0A0B4GYQ1_METGA|nr:extracellular serine-rich protein [Metarhizium guizhouense ARSEF 977]